MFPLFYAVDASQRFPRYRLSTCISFLALFFLGIGILCVPLHAEEPTAHISSGELRGKMIGDGKVKAFLGIPYAAPPVGNLRWQKPQAAESWKGVRAADHYASHCAQRKVFEDMIFQDNSASEDCLYLNVYAPATASPTGKLPVMFWIHGGGFSGGAASEPRHNGDYLPTKGVILVTINYRLGVFGFLATSELAKEQDGVAGNYGLMDIIAALKWVKKNIGSFGGDPQNVLIFGESAGSFAVSTLMASPEAKDLFQKAIGESGAAFGGVTLAYEPLSLRTKKDDAWVSSLGVTSLGQLRHIPTEELLTDVAKSENIVRFAPIIDGKVLTQAVEQTYAEGKQAHIPLIAGWNRDEASFGGPTITPEQWKAQAEKLYPGNAERFLNLYPAANNEQTQRSVLDFSGDQFIALGTWKWIEAHSKTGAAPVYRYRLDLVAPPSKYHPAAAFHSDDIEYVFGVLDTRPGAKWTEADRKLSDQITSYWTNFARTGNPNAEGLPEWPRYDTERKVLYLDNPITAKKDANEGRYLFLIERENAAKANPSLPTEKKN